MPTPVQSCRRLLIAAGLLLAACRYEPINPATFEPDDARTTPVPRDTAAAAEDTQVPAAEDGGAPAADAETTDLLPATMPDAGTAPGTDAAATPGSDAAPTPRPDAAPIPRPDAAPDRPPVTPMPMPMPRPCGPADGACPAGCAKDPDCLPRPTDCVHIEWCRKPVQPYQGRVICQTADNARCTDAERISECAREATRICGAGHLKPIQYVPAIGGRPTG